jgi:3-hydroxyisobutyrate dehydrogenase-like beta-hydroxyacid dehydrogenase
MTVIGLLHPGDMGAAVGNVLRLAGHQVLYASQGRSADTVQRAGAAGLTDAGTVSELTARSEVVLSICPPAAALDVARLVDGFTGIYIDANAISPATTRTVATVIETGGGRFVDGGIIGGPPDPDRVGATRLYLSGALAPDVVGLFDGTALDARVVGFEAGHASALKLCFAAWTKGTAALLLAIRATAEAEGVEDALLAEWAISQPELAKRSASAVASAQSKGWRWVGEMEEIAATFANAGLPDGFHMAAAEVFSYYPRSTGS